ncbi:FAD binding domain-containing protein [Halalkalibacter kiskunsagensis]|uniref:FAD binding domain-containing protein n=1 Tax=Halalkalibacter kiskunsagensis TaxID=1548599 RepID=A0ABV6KCR9_9BACI
MLTAQKIWSPTNLKEAWEIQNHIGIGEYCLVSGGTWLRTQWEANLREMSTNLISLEKIAEMQEVTEQLAFGKREIVIGAQVTLANCIESELMQTYLPSLVKACRRIAAPSIRNQATIGGNIYTAAGDTIPVFLIYEAKLRWFNGQTIETEPLEQWLITLQANQFKRDNRMLVGLTIEVEAQDDFSFFIKVGRRETFTASLVTVAGKGTVDNNGLFGSVLLAAGGGPVPARLSATELATCNRSGSTELFKSIYKSITTEFEATTDAFASAEYKKTVVANLLVSELFDRWEKNHLGGVTNVAGS